MKEERRTSKEKIEEETLSFIKAMVDLGIHQKLEFLGKETVNNLKEIFQVF